MRNIIFKSVEIKNFKIHKDLSISFEEPFIMIIGNNGSGKSSIFSAIAWALYDETLEGMKGDSIVNRQVGKNTEVIVKMIIDDEDYEVRAYRKHKEHKNNKYLYKNGKIITSSNSDFEEKIESILPKEVFFMVLSSAGGSLIDMTNSERLSIFERMFKLDYSSYQEKAKKYVDSIKSSINAIEKELDRCIGRINTNELFIEDRKKEIDRLENEKEMFANRLEEEIKNEESEVARLRNKIEELKPLCEELQQKKNKLVLLKSELENIEREKKSLFENLNNQYQSEKRACLADNDLVRKIMSLESTLSKVSQEMSSKISNVSREISILNERIKERQKLYSNTQMEISELSSEKKELARKLDSFRKGRENRRCPVCGQEIKDLSHFDNEILKIEGLMTEIDKKIISRKRQEESIKNEIDELENRLKEKNAIKSSTEEEYSKRIENVRKSIESSKAEKESFEKKIVEELKNKYKRIFEERTFELNKRGKELNELISEIEKINFSPIDELNNLSELLIRKETELKNKKINGKNKIDDYNLMIIKASKEIEKYNEEIERLRKEKETIERNLIEKKEKLTIGEFWVDAFSNTGGIKSFVIDTIIPFLNEKATELCRNLSIRVFFDAQKQLKSGEFKSSFDIRARHVTNFSELKELSSGERKLVQLVVIMAMRYAFEVFNNVNINILLLDEILDSLDEMNVDIVLSMLKSLSSSLTNKCIVLITHTQKSKMLATGDIAMYSLQ